MQISVNYNAVGTFNRNAPALEQGTIRGITYEVFHDYYHLRDLVLRGGAVVCRKHKSVGFRRAGEPDSFNFCARAFKRRACNEQRELQAWMDAMKAKYTDDVDPLANMAD